MSPQGSSSSRPEPTRPPPRAMVLSFYIPALVLIAGGLVYGLLDIPGREMFLVVAGAMLALMLMLAPIALRLEASAAEDPSRKLDALSDEIRRLSQHAALSDDARRVLNRDQERELLRSAIDEDIDREDWDAAMVLVSELADRFGYRADAEELRSRIETARSHRQDQAIGSAVAHLDSLIAQRRWEPAFQEAARIRRLYPDAMRTAELDQRVSRAQGLYKEDLERRFLTAAQEERTGDAMDLLRELDVYLTEEEAAPFREAARTVIDGLRKQLGEDFKQAMQDHDYERAEIIGTRIINEFPNSRMSQEVREVIESVRQKNTAS